jgi:hypothetical protein
VLNLGVGGAIAIALGAALLFVAGDGAARGKKKGKGKKGKVVRVERSSVAPGVVRWCGNPRADGGATCWGTPPEVGDVGAVMDQQSVRATVKVTDVKGMPDGCGNIGSWEVASRVQSGDLSSFTGTGAMVFDWDTTSRSRAMDMYNPPVTPPNKYANPEYMLGAIDDDADARADLIVTWFYCDAAGTSSASASGHYCLVHYGLEGTSYRELRFDIVKNCP